MTALRSTCLLLTACGAAASLWPQPQSVALGGTAVVLSRSFTFTVNGTNSILQAALKRFSSILFLEAPPLTPFLGPVNSGTPLAEVVVTLRNVSEALGFSTSEAYSLDIVDGSATASLVSDTVYGALRGLETLTQLVEYRVDAPAAAAFICVTARVVDAPRFAHRGALVDTSRHFLPVPTLYAFIDAMAMNKLNVFHWHIVDDNSFPWVSTTFPALSVQGAWGGFASYTYSPADVAAVIAYAQARGVRTVVELDTPGHTQSWGKGQPDLLTPCYKDGTPDGSFGPVDPTRDTTWSFLAALFAEAARVFPDDYMHIGGDEVDFSCWASNPGVVTWMAAHGMAGNFSALESYYVQRVLDLVTGLGKRAVGWEELFDNRLALPPNAIVNVWKYHNSPTAPPPTAPTWQSEIANVTLAGYPALLSSPWYLNVIAYGIDWPQFYEAEPTNFTGTPAQKALVIGGELSMWGEWVDETNLISRTWPRGGAVAERLWSAEGVRDIASATARLGDQRCRMLARGLPAGPLGPSYCPPRGPGIA